MSGPAADDREVEPAAGHGPGTPTGLGHRPPLDGLRAVAVAAVLLYHGGAAWLPGGFLGVSVFFTLSGFLITSLLVGEWSGSGGIDLRRFWSRRFRRLLPASWLTMAAVVAVGALGWWDVEQLRDLRGDVPWSLAELLNWHLIAGGVDYAESAGPPSPLLHYWSLAVEQQFYVVLPLVVLGALAVGRRWGRRRALALLAAVLAAVALVSAVRNGVLAATSVDRAYFGTDTRAAELLIGGLLAVGVAARGGPSTTSRRTRRAAVVLGALGGGGLVVLAATATVPASWLYPWGLMACAVCTATLILGSLQPGRLGAVLSVGALCGLGRISYGVYLLHWPVFLLLTPARVGVGGVALFALRVAVSVGLAAAMFRLVEWPIRHGGRLPMPWSLRALPIAAAVLLVATMVVTAALPPPPSYLRPAPDEVVVREPDATTPGTATPPTVPPGDPSASTVPPPPPVVASRVLLVGDSVAASIQEPLGDTLVELGVGFGGAAAPGCGIVAGYPTDEEGRVAEMTRACHDAVPRRQLEAVAEVEPDLVLAMSSWEMTNRQLDGVWYPFGTPEADEMLRRLLREAVDRLSSGGARVALVAVPEPVPGEVQEVGPQEVQRARHLNGLLAEVAAADPARVSVLGLDRVVCPADPCPLEVAGLRPRPRDGRHFDGEAASTWAAQRLAELALAVDLARP